MMIAARNAFLMGGASTPTARDYVQDGLIAMWDGIENAGWGVHDASATVWKDLAGSNDFSLSRNNLFDDAAINVSANIGLAKTGMNYPMLSESNVGTIEVSRIYSRGSCILRITSTRILVSRGAGGMQFTRGYSNDKTCAFSTADTYSCAFLSNTEPYSVALYANGESVSPVFWTAWGGGGPGELSPNYYAFTGKVRFIRIYSRALTAAEVAANYAVDAARFGL